MQLLHRDQVIGCAVRVRGSRIQGREIFWVVAGTTFARKMLIRS